MKKITKIGIGIILIMAMIITLCPKSYGKFNPSLKDIYELFNAHKLVKKYNQDSATINLIPSYDNGDEEHNPTFTVSVNKLDETTGHIDSVKLVYTLKGTVLEAAYYEGNSTIREYWKTVTPIIIDCIGQVHGYAEGEMIDTLNASGIANYSLEEDGLYINDNSVNVYQVQIDINTVVSIIDTNTFIKVEDLSDYTSGLSGDSLVQYKKGKLPFYKYTVDDKDILMVGEQKQFSYIIDRSIINILKVMFGDDESAEYFQANYPTVSQNKEFKGFKVEVNPIKTSTEEMQFSSGNYKCVRITIDKTAVKEALEANSGKEISKTPVEKDPVAEVPEKEDGDEDGKVEIPENGKENGSENGSNNGSQTGTSSGTSSTAGSTGATSTAAIAAENSGVLPKTGSSEAKGAITYLYFVLVAALMGIMGIGMSTKKKQK